MKASRMMTRIWLVFAIEAATALVPRRATAAANICGEQCMASCDIPCVSFTSGLCPTDGECYEDNVFCSPGWVAKWCY